MTQQTRLLAGGITVAFAAALGFALLAQAVMTGQTSAFDAGVRGAIHSWANPALTMALQLVTEMGTPYFLIPLGAAIVWRLAAAGRRHAAVLFAIAAVGAEICDQALKYTFRRPRPEVFFGLVQPISFSFPSGHSVESCCFFGAWAAILSATTPSLLQKSLIWMTAILLTLSIGLSRVYLGVHYPTDVLGGYAVAVAWAALVHNGYLIWRRRSGD